MANALVNGADINAFYNDGSFPLYAAAEVGDAELVRFLLEKGADAQQLNRTGGRSALSAACEAGHLGAARVLLEVAGPHEGRGRPPLFVAARDGRLDLVELLLAKGVAIDQAMKDGRTPLFIAAQNGHLAVTELLLSKGAAVDRAEEHGATPLCIASEKGRLAVIERLLAAGAAIDQADEDGCTPLCMAAQNGHRAEVELLLAEGAAIGPTPLFHASERGHTAVVRLLLAKGAGVDLEGTRGGATPLWIAAHCGYADVVELLLDGGAAIDRADDYGSTPLNAAASSGHLEVVDLLLVKGAVVLRRSNDGFAPLHSACEQSHIRVVRRLLDAGSPPIWTDGSSLLRWSHKTRKYGVTTELLRRGLGDTEPKVLRKLAEEAQRSSPCRVTVLGAAAAGKSTLVQLLQLRLKSSSAKFPTANLATDGISVERVRDLVFWDFGGQEVLHSTHQFFLTEEAQYVVVVDLARFAAGAPEYLRDVDYWLALAARWAGGVGAPPALVVATHCDQLPEAAGAMVRLRAASAAAGLRDPVFFQIERRPDGSLKKLPLKDMLARIEKHAAEIIQRQRGFTKASVDKLRFEHTVLRLRVEDERAGGVKFVWWDEFLRFCAESGVDPGDAAAVQRATTFLVNFGAIVTYRQMSTGASALVVLDPVWLSRAFTSIVSIKLVTSEQRRGFLRLENLHARWRELDMAEDSWPQLMNLFSLFQLLVQLPDGRLFVPSLLRTPKASGAPVTPQQRDAFLGEQRPAHVYGRTVRVSPVIPSGLVDRLVVRVLHFPGLDVVEGATWIDDFVLSSPFGFVRLQCFPDSDSLSLQLYSTSSPSSDLAFFAHFLFESPLAVLSSYFRESQIASSTVIFDGAERGAESALCLRALHGTPMPDSPDLDLQGVPRLEPATLVVGEKLDEGTFGIVSRATLFGHAVVVKQLKNIESSVKHQREFFREVLMMMRFRDSPYLVRLLGVCPASPAMLMVLEFAPLGDLTKCHDHLRSLAGSKLKVKLTYDLARGLRNLHSSDGLQLIHRDVRSQNFFIFSLDEHDAQLDSEAVHGKLGDFGTVVVASPNYGEELGNFQYMAPEAFRGALAVPYSRAIDVYSFGVLAWEIFAGQIPYREYIMNAGEGRRKILAGERPPFPERDDVGGFPESVQALIKECWQGDPEKRPTFTSIVSRLEGMKESN